MDSSSTQGFLELEVANFGPIIKGKIELRPLTVFIGPSNTGKSYLAILIYALHRYFTGGGLWPGRRHFRRGYRMLQDDGPQKLPRETIVALAELGRQMLSDKRKPLLDKGIVLPASIADVIRSGVATPRSDLGNEISRCFGLDKEGALVREGNRGGARIVLQRPVSDSVPVEHELTIRAQGTEFRTTIPEGMSMRIDVGNADEPIAYLRHLASEMISISDRMEERLVFLAGYLMESLADFIRPQVVAPLHLPAFYLPADRTGVMHAHSVVVSALIESAAMTGLRPAARTPMLSGVLADFLEQLIELDPLPHRQRKSGHDPGTQIEEAILGGSVSIDKSEAIGYPRFTYRPDGWKRNLSLMNASSMVSELAPVVLYLRHMVGPDNVLIVEEPESHLHPAMQVEFTRQLAALVRSGVRVIVTTHSEWVLEELANIVRRSELPESERKKIAGGDCSLGSDQVGAWLFQPKGRPKGSVVKEIRLDDSGLYPSGFDEVAAALHNNWAEISSRIGETE